MRDEYYVHLADVLRVFPRGVRCGVRMGLRPIHCRASDEGACSAVRAGVMSELKPFGFFRHQNRDPWEDAPHWALELGIMLGIVIANQETIMIDVTALQAVAARLQASDTAALSALQALKDQNTALAAQLAAIPTQDPTTQAAINDVVTALTGTADAVDKAVAANPATPNLTPSPAV